MLNFHLYGIIAIVNILSFVVGCFFSWTSPAIPKLKNQYGESQNPLEYIISPDEESWLAFLTPLGAAVSIFISGYAADKIGRKNILFLSALMAVCGIVLTMVSTNIRSFYLARFFCGLGVGTVFTVTPLFVAEIAELRNRGILGCIMTLSITLGIVSNYIIGPILTLLQLSYFHLVTGVIFLLLLFFLVPESPYYLIEKNRHNEAYCTLRKLRIGSEDQVMDEFEEMKKNIETSFQHQGSLQDLFREPELFRAIIITCSLMMFQQLSGINIIPFFVQSIFEETGSRISPESSAITIGLVQILACIIATIFVDRLGRKILMLISCIGTALSLTCFGVYFYLKESGDDIALIYWLPILSIICFIIAYSLGLGPIPFVVLGELFPPSIKFLASTITIFVCLLLTFCTTTFFPRIIEVIGMVYTFWTLAVFSFIGAIFIYGFLPETKWRTLSEIQAILRNA